MAEGDAPRRRQGQFARSGPLGLIGDLLGFAVKGLGSALGAAEDNPVVSSFAVSLSPSLALQEQERVRQDRMMQERLVKEYENLRMSALRGERRPEQVIGLMREYGSPDLAAQMEADLEPLLMERPGLGFSRAAARQPAGDAQGLPPLGEPSARGLPQKAIMPQIEGGILTGFSSGDRPVSPAQDSGFGLQAALERASPAMREGEAARAGTAFSRAQNERESIGALRDEVLSRIARERSLENVTPEELAVVFAPDVGQVGASAMRTRVGALETGARLAADAQKRQDDMESEFRTTAALLAALDVLEDTGQALPEETAPVRAIVRSFDKAVSGPAVRAFIEDVRKASLDLETAEGKKALEEKWSRYDKNREFDAAKVRFALSSALQAKGLIGPDGPTIAELSEVYLGILEDPAGVNLKAIGLGPQQERILRAGLEKYTSERENHIKAWAALDKSRTRVSRGFFGASTKPVTDVLDQDQLVAQAAALNDQALSMLSSHLVKIPGIQGAAALDAARSLLRVRVGEGPSARFIPASLLPSLKREDAKAARLDVSPESAVTIDGIAYRPVMAPDPKDGKMRVWLVAQERTQGMGPREAEPVNPAVEAAARRAIGAPPARAQGGR